MKILTVDTPIFEHNGEIYYVESKMFLSLSEFDKYLNNKKPNYVYIYKLTNINNDYSLIHPCDGFDKVREDVNIIFIYFKILN